MALCKGCWLNPTMDNWQQSHLRQKATQQNNKEHIIFLWHQFPSPVSHMVIWTAVLAWRRPTGLRFRLGSGLPPGNFSSDYILRSWPYMILLWNTLALKYPSHAADNLLLASEQCNLRASLWVRSSVCWHARNAGRAVIKNFRSIPLDHPTVVLLPAFQMPPGTHRSCVWAAPATDNPMHIPLHGCSPSCDRQNSWSLSTMSPFLALPWLCMSVCPSLSMAKIQTELNIFLSVAGWGSHIPVLNPDTS